MEQRGIWEVRVGIYATRQQAEELMEQIQRLLCPDPDHTPPCPIPWTTMLLAGEDLGEPDSYAGLVEQYRIEHPALPDGVEHPGQPDR